MDPSHDLGRPKWRLGEAAPAFFFRGGNPLRRPTRGRGEMAFASSEVMEPMPGTVR
jgi:hypothetical protein